MPRTDRQRMGPETKGRGVTGPCPSFLVPCMWSVCGQLRGLGPAGGPGPGRAEGMVTLPPGIRAEGLLKLKWPR